MLRTIADHWDGRAATFDGDPDHGLVEEEARAAWAGRLDGWLPAPPARVADLGCGTGSLAVLLAGRGYDVVASDIAPEMVQRARRKATEAGVDVDLSVADAAEPGLPEASVDVVLVRHLVWTLADPEAAIETWRSLLRPGGRLVMVEGRWGTPAQPDDEVDHGDYAPVHRSLPWYGGVSAATLLPVLQERFDRVEHHDLTGEDALWGHAVADERYAVVARLG